MSKAQYGDKKKKGGKDGILITNSVSDQSNKFIEIVTELTEAIRSGFCTIRVIMSCMYGLCIMFWNISGLLDICCIRDCMAGVWNMLFIGLPA